MSTSTPWKPDWSIHPGEILAELLEERGGPAVSGMPPEEVDRLLAGVGRVTAAYADLIAVATGTSSALWVGLQREHDLRAEGR